MATSEASTRRRVKLYMLNEERQWDDKGTGHVSAIYTPEQNNMALVVVSENDGSRLLESKIQPDTAYQKQQETLIVWSEGENMDLALSFQEKIGCDDIWEKICTVLGKDPTVEITQDIIDESDEAEDGDGEPPTSHNSDSSLDLPPCDLNHLEEIAELFNQSASNMMHRERIADALEHNNFIRQLADLFHKAEDLENLEALHFIYDIIRHIIQFNKHRLYEIIFAEELLWDVIGMLEYSHSGRTNHRDFLKNQSHFKEVLPLHNPELISKIHQTYRVQYIQDCCLPPPSLFDDNVLSTLTSFVFFNKIEIVTSLQEDDKFMKHLFTQLRDEETDDVRRRDLALFVKEFCSISVTLQGTQKENLFSSLSRHGALKAVEVLLVSDDKLTKSASLDILNTFVDNHPGLVREFVFKESQENGDNDKLLINIMIDQMISDTDPELGDAVLLVNMLRSLIDPDNMLPNNPGLRTEKTEFLTFFYRRCINTLTAPLFENTKSDYPVQDDYRTALVLCHVLDLLTFCIENHTYHMKNHVFNKDLVKKVLVLLKSQHKFLVLTALRLLRRVVNMKEEFYNRYLIKNNLFKPVVDLFLRNGCRYNLLDSAVIELFDYIRQEDIASLVAHIVERHWDDLKDKNYVNTFAGLRLRYEQSLDRTMRSETTPSPLECLNIGNRFRREARGMEEEEEQWFDQDDDDEASPDLPLSLPPSLGPNNPPPTDRPLSVLDRFQERLRRPKNYLAGGSIDGNSPSPPALGSNRAQLRIGRIRFPQNHSSPFSPGEDNEDETENVPVQIPSNDALSRSPLGVDSSPPLETSVKLDPGNIMVFDSSPMVITSCAPPVVSPTGISIEADSISCDQTTNKTDTIVNVLGGLVDYSDEESEEEEDDIPSAKRLKVTP